MKSISTSFRLKNDQLSAFEKNLEYLRPEKVLMRGYSISSSGGKLIKDAIYLKEGDELTTRFLKGTSVSIIKKTNKE
jgi:exodeoxyribonuclease VII large subunit